MKHISGDRGEEENADYSVCVLVQKCCRYVVAFLRNMRLKAHGVPAVFNFGSLTTVSLAVRYRYAFLIGRSEEHTSELQSLMRISYAVFCLNNKTKKQTHN